MLYAHMEVVYAMCVVFTVVWGRVWLGESCRAGCERVRGRRDEADEGGMMSGASRVLLCVRRGTCERRTPADSV